MKKSIFIFCLFLIAGGVILESCSKVPVTGRRQMNLLPKSVIGSMSLDQYKQVLQQSNVDKTGQHVQVVQRVGKNVAGAVNNFFRQNKQSDRIKDFAWEFNVINEDVVNAWCMPKGKVAIYTGILPVAKDENGLAVVMGHEVAHAVARHGNERMSQGLLQQMGGLGLAIALRNKPQETQNLFNQAYGIGTTVGAMLPFSRKQETEADELGLIFMAMAGYDPKVAPGFWKRMAAAGGGEQPPEFLSTHPSHSTRIKNLGAYIPTAMKHYKGPNGTGDVVINVPPSSGNNRNGGRNTTTTNQPNKPNTNTSTKPSSKPNIPSKPNRGRVRTRPSKKPGN